MSKNVRPGLVGPDRRNIFCSKDYIKKSMVSEISHCLKDTYDCGKKLSYELGRNYS